MRGIEFKTIRNENGIVIGFDLCAEPAEEERHFVQTLPNSLGMGQANFLFYTDSIFIENGPEVRSFKLPPNEVAIIKEYIDSLGDDTKIEPIKLIGFGSTITFRFINEDIVKRYSS
jgi:hypothetical protein